MIVKEYLKNKKTESKEVQMVNPFTPVSATDTYRFYSAVWHQEILLAMDNVPTPWEW